MTAPEVAGGGGLMTEQERAELTVVLDALRLHLTALTPLKDQSLLLHLVWNDLNSAIYGLEMATDRTPPPDERGIPWQGSTSS